MNWYACGHDISFYHSLFRIWSSGLEGTSSPHQFIEVHWKSDKNSKHFLRPVTLSFDMNKHGAPTCNMLMLCFFFGCPQDKMSRHHLNLFFFGNYYHTFCVHVQHVLLSVVETQDFSQDISFQNCCSKCYRTE